MRLRHDVLLRLLPDVPGGLMRQMSKKREAERAERAKVREAVRRRDGSCRARDVAPGRCGGPLDVHEVIPRSAWRAGYLVVDNCLLVCRRHHDWIGAEPDAAHDLGLHGYSYERPDYRRDNET